MTLLDTMKAERTKLVKALETHKADPAITARITELKTELAKLTAQLSGADLKAQIAAVDRAIKAVENPNRISKPMSDAGKAAIKEGLRKYHENRKAAAQAPAVPPPAAKPTKKSQATP
ncbi:MAG: hypothetical protein LAN18_09075 [Acidobacteriia bacterium]|nr:hypothetical protein [Terriglobia bacterium]